ncbi:MAG: hypothetical protein QGG26_15070, partial [Candidatus Undinarchaeales archaeon]|nr:hypothetical protein [Candidatus Undinarchaeales archaeon]
RERSDGVGRGGKRRGYATKHFMIVLSGLPSVNVSEIMFWMLYAGVAVFQFMFMGMIKQKRPSLLG